MEKFLKQVFTKKSLFEFSLFTLIFNTTWISPVYYSVIEASQALSVPQIVMSSVYGFMSYTVASAVTKFIYKVN